MNPVPQPNLQSPPIKFIAPMRLGLLSDTLKQIKYVPSVKTVTHDLANQRNLS